MKKIEKVLCLCLIGIFMILPSDYVFANSIDAAEESIVAQSSISRYSDIEIVTSGAVNEKSNRIYPSISSSYNQSQVCSLSNDASMKLVQEETEVFEEGDVVIKTEGKVREETKC